MQALALLLSECIPDTASMIFLFVNWIPQTRYGPFTPLRSVGSRTVLCDWAARHGRRHSCAEERLNGTQPRLIPYPGHRSARSTVSRNDLQLFNPRPV